MEYNLKDALCAGLERAIERNREVELIVPRLKCIWPRSCNRRELLQQIEAFAAENRWGVAIADYGFRVRFSKIQL